MGLENVEWDDCLLEPRRDAELEAYVRREYGTVPSAVPYLAPLPWLVRSMVDSSHYRVGLVHTSFELGDLVGLVVSQDNSCRYCYATQRALLLTQGVPEEHIQRLEHDLLRAEIDPRERLALDFSRRVSRGSPLAAEADCDRLRAAGYSSEAIKELAFVAAGHVFMNRVTTLPAIPPGEMEAVRDRRLRRWLAPVARRMLRGHQRRGRPETLPAEMRSGPFAYLVTALDGLPAARVLRGVIDAAFASPVLDMRPKLLALAVVARGLGCPLAEAEAARLLGETGLAADEVEEIVAHLGASSLDARDAAVARFARETIRYRPIQVQRRARELRDLIGREQLLEVIGVASLANALCRLGVVVVA